MPKTKRINENQLQLLPEEEELPLLPLLPLLPCAHLETITKQLEATKDLLRNLHTAHPEILREHSIDPDAYIDSMLFRSAGADSTLCNPQ